MSGSDDGLDPALAVGVPIPVGALIISAQPHPAGPVVLHARGEIDTATAPFLTEQIAAALATATGLLLDLGEVSFLSSAGLAALLAARDDAAAAGASLQLACGNSRAVRRVLHITGTLEVFNVLDPTPVAVDALSTPIFPVPDLEH